MSTQGVGIDFLREELVDWRDTFDVDLEVGNQEIEEGDNDEIIILHQNLMIGLVL